MANNENKDNKKPDQKLRVGKFTLSIWHNKKTVGNGSPDSTAYSEREIQYSRCCLQYSYRDWTTGRWVNQQIFFPLRDIRDISNLLDEHDKALTGGEEEDSPSPHSIRYGLLWRILHYVTNRIDYLQEFNLDWADLKCYPVRQILQDIGITEELTAGELEIISRELERIAEASQTREIAQIYEPSIYDV